MTLAIFQGH